MKAPNTTQRDLRLHPISASSRNPRFKRGLKITAWAVVSLFLMLMTFSAWLGTTDLGIFKPRIESWVSQMTGRQFAIGGNLSINLGGQSVLIAEDIRLQNAAWAAEPEMLTIDRLEVRIDLGSLVRGPLIVDLVDMQGAQVFLTRPQDGVPNWLLGGADGTEPKGTDDGGPAFGLLVKEIDVQDMHLIFETPERAGPIDVRVFRFEQQHRADERVEIALDGSINASDIRFEAEIGTWQALLDGENIQFTIDGILDGFSIKGNGFIDSLTEPRRPTIAFSAHGPDINQLLSIFSVPDRGEGDINLSGSLVAQDGEPLVLSVNGNLGQNKIKSSGIFSDLHDFEKIDFNLFASGPALGRVLRLVGINKVHEKTPYMIKIDAQRDGSMVVVEQAQMVFADTRLDLSGQMPNFPGIDDSNLDLKISGQRFERFRDILQLPGAATGPFRLKAKLVTPPDRIELIRLDVTTSLGKLVAQGRVGDAPNYFGTELDFSLNASSLASLAGAYGLPDLPDLPVAVRGAASLTPDGIRIRGPMVARAGELQVQLDGLLTLVSGLVGSDIGFKFGGPNLAKLVGAFVSDAPAPDIPYILGGGLRVGKERDFVFRDVKGMIGKSSVQVAGSLKPAAGFVGTRLDFKAAGPAFEELINSFEGITIYPGPYSLAGGIRVDRNVIEFSNVALNRNRGKVNLSLALGLPVSRQWADFNLRAEGHDVRALLGGISLFEVDAAPFILRGRGRLRKQLVELDQFDVGIGDASLNASGDLNLSGNGKSTRFHFAASVPNLGGIGRVNGRRLTNQRFTIEGDAVSGSGLLSIDHLQARLGESDIRGNVQYRISDTPELLVDIYADSIFYKPIFEPKAEKKEPTFADGRLIPDIPLPINAMKQLNADVRLKIGELKYETSHFQNLAVEGRLQGGTLALTKFGIDGDSGHLDARATILPDQDAGGGAVNIELVARDFVLGPIVANHDHLLKGDIDLSLHATGTDLRSLAATVDGVLFINTRGGRAGKNRILTAIYGGALEELISAVIPFYEAESFTQLKCSVVPLNLKNGQLTSVPNAFFLTDKVSITIVPEVNLETEAINLSFRTVPRKGLLISAGEIFNPLVSVAGTLAEPRLAVDQQGMLVSGGAAVATGGLSILARAAWDRLSKSRDPCGDVAKQAIAKLGDRFPRFLEIGE